MESVMSASPTLQFEIPNEMRAVAERSVELAKVAFQQLMQAAEEAVSTLDLTSFFQNCKALISLSFIESEGSVTGYDPG